MISYVTYVGFQGKGERLGGIETFFFLFPKSYVNYVTESMHIDFNYVR